MRFAEKYIPTTAQKEGEEVKIMINNLMADILTGKFNIKVW